MRIMIPENEYTVILPTFNEAQNVGILIEKLLGTHSNISIIVTDDGSTDNTKNVVLSYQNKRIYFLDRKNKDVHGLTASILDATKMVRSKYFIVMDGDMQHPWEKVGEIMDDLKDGAKLVIASRSKVEGHWPRFRKTLSYLGSFLGKGSLLARGKNFLCHDILTGFFGVEARLWKDVVFEKNNISYFKLRGYKILFDFLKIMPHNIEIKSINYIFGVRKKGSSKLNNRVYMEYLKSIFY